MSISVVVVGFGDEPVLPACLTAIVQQLDDGDEVVLVDHGVTDVPAVDGVRVVTPSAQRRVRCRLRRGGRCHHG